ncbi:uncharacterized protein LOC119989719 isoform X2 [Tripterygium wilfordii]|uniref:uncharacterized protein LOC119989719 isoform X2 n=1 Tax=Tripterygium wilfordii TaxID=458696 RepID=UPI0018F84BD8|nr:uncharacterized protein LOC119989719 isoform X2 [Tripterygium wilfordii]
MSTKHNKVSKNKMSLPVSSNKRSFDDEEQKENKNLKRLKKVVAECRAQTESATEFQKNMLRDLDHIKSDLIGIGKINQPVIERNTHILVLLDLLMLVIIFDGSVSSVILCLLIFLE